MKVWLLVQEVESGAERDEVIGVYATEKAATDTMDAEADQHEFEDGDDWCHCRSDDCSGGYCWRVRGMDVIE